MKLFLALVRPFPERRPPRGGRGLKYPVPWNKYEIGYGRPPRGGRGLKYVSVYVPITSTESPPSRGAWIEIVFEGGVFLVDYVAPLAGGVD